MDNSEDSLVPSPAILLQSDSNEDVVQVNVHPLVLLSVLDHHTRRQEAAGRVIGTLLGRRDSNKVEITNCFAVPHFERGDDEVAIGKDFNKQMLSLHLRANRKEVVVGWYASVAAEEDSGLIIDTSSLIHDFYSGECDDGDPVHLVVDPRLLSDNLAIRAYKSTSVQVEGEPLANLFHEVNLSLHSSDSENICLHQMTRSDEHVEPLPSNDANLALQSSMEKLLSLLEKSSQYVTDVVDGKVTPDSRSGRKLADALAVVPRIRPEVFDRLFNDSLQDLLMVTYLSNITRTQLAVAEKLNESLGV